MTRRLAVAALLVIAAVIAAPETGRRHGRTPGDVLEAALRVLRASMRDTFPWEIPSCSASWTWVTCRDWRISPCASAPSGVRRGRAGLPGPRQAPLAGSWHVAHFELMKARQGLAKSTRCV